MPTTTIPLTLDHPATHLDVKPGDEIVLKGSFHSATDGSVVDAATTTWPAGAPGGTSVDTGGLVDFSGGGFHVVSRDPVSHEVHAVATSDGGAACAAMGSTAPCLPLRTLTQARSRLLTTADWSRSLMGGISVEVPEVLPPPLIPDTPWVPRVAGATLAIAAVGLVALALKRRGESPAARLAALAKEVQKKAKRADPVIAAPLTPALDRALSALREGRVSATSREGQRLRAMLENVDRRLDGSAQKARLEGEAQVADELVHEVESALEAADEAMQLGRR